MSIIRLEDRQIHSKIVYYGPGLSGKTKNLEWIYNHINPQWRGKMLSVATESERTLFFDFLPVSLSLAYGFRSIFQFYTVPGQSFYNATRRAVLENVDGIVFVADSQEERLDANIDSFFNMEENLASYGLNLRSVPVVMQYNKRDLPSAVPIETLQLELNQMGFPETQAVAIRGVGVLETMKLIVSLVHRRAKETLFGETA